MRKWILIILALLAVLGLAIYLFFPKAVQKEKETNANSISYFAEDASVMFFYSDYCGWCKRQEVVLKELAKEGYKVKPMNIGIHKEYIRIYNIEGTPAFIAKNGEKLVGYHDYQSLKKWFDKVQ